jgi:hypothetical protein
MAKYGYRVVDSPGSGRQPHVVRVAVTSRTETHVNVVYSPESYFRRWFTPAEFDREFSSTVARAIKRWRAHLNFEASKLERAADYMRRLAVKEVVVPKEWGDA